MSASEKLKALDADIGGFGPYPISDFPEDGPALKAIRNALPQIVAVVEAAELYAEVLDEAHLMETALAALDEALGESSV